MKKLVFLVLTVILAKISLSQSISYRSNGVVTVSDMRLQAEKNFFVPRYNDTTEANLNKGIDSCGALIFSRDVNAYYYRACNPKKWTLIAAATGGTPWTLAGNSDAVAGSNFLGTTNDVPLEFRIKNVKSGIIDSTTRNTALGFASQRKTTSATNNTSLGWRTLDSTTSGSSNVAIGVLAMKDNVTGTSNTAVGYGALNQGKSPFFDVAIGRGALARDSFGFANVGVGYDVANNLAPVVGVDTMQYNTMIGFRAGVNQRGGRNNVFVGDSSGGLNEVGRRNVFIGSRAGKNETGSDKLYIANSNTSTPLIKGDFANSTLNVNGKLSVGNSSTPDSALTVNGGVRLSSLYPSNSASDSMLVIKSNGALGYRSISGGGGTTPTLQQVLTAGSTLTGINTITGDSRTLIQQLGPNGTSGSYSRLFIDTSNTAFAFKGTATGSFSDLSLSLNLASIRSSVGSQGSFALIRPQSAAFNYTNTGTKNLTFSLDSNGIRYQDFIRNVSYRFPVLGGTVGQVLKLTSAGQITFANDSTGGGGSTDTTSLSNRINQAFTSATKLTDTSFFMSSPTGTNDTITLNGAPVYVESPIMAKVSNDSNIIYFNADTANAWRGGSGTIPTLQQVTTAGNTTTNDIFANSFTSSGGVIVGDDGAMTAGSYNFILGGVIYGSGVNAWILPNYSDTLVGKDYVIDTLKRSNDSIFAYKNNQWVFQYTDSVGSGSNVANDTAKVVIAKVRNVTATTLQRGEVVYLFGASGDVASVKRANNKSDSTSAKTFGIVRRNIAAGDTGYITTQGQIEKLNLGAFAEGDILWLDSLDGQFTKVKPQAPYHSVFLGVVERANAGNGLMYVKPQNGVELDEIHDVQINNLQNNQIIVYSDTQQVWKNRSAYTVIDTTKLQQKSLPAYSIMGNNTNVAANPTAVTFKDTSGIYTGTIVWTANAPSGTTNHTFAFTQIGKMVTMLVRLNYATAPVSTNTQVTLSFPSYFPEPAIPSGLNNASELIYPGVGYLFTSTALANNISRAGIRRNSTNTATEMVIIIGSAATHRAAWISVTYYTN